MLRVDKQKHMENIHMLKVLVQLLTEKQLLPMPKDKILKLLEPVLIVKAITPLLVELVLMQKVIKQKQVVLILMLQVVTRKQLQSIAM
jgi:hypothetical protein